MDAFAEARERLEAIARHATRLLRPSMAESILAELDTLRARLADVTKERDDLRAEKERSAKLEAILEGQRPGLAMELKRVIGERDAMAVVVVAARNLREKREAVRVADEDALEKGEVTSSFWGAVRGLMRALNALDQSRAEQRCRHTGNPCGADTWPDGLVCPCEPCQRYLAEQGDQSHPYRPEPVSLSHEQLADVSREGLEFRRATERALGNQSQPPCFLTPADPGQRAAPAVNDGGGVAAIGEPRPAADIMESEWRVDGADIYAGDAEAPFCRALFLDIARAIVDAHNAAAEPIPMILMCPECGTSVALPSSSGGPHHSKMRCRCPALVRCMCSVPLARLPAATSSASAVRKPWSTSRSTTTPERIRKVRIGASSETAHAF